MSDLISRNEVIDILAKMKFFQGQRAGRELWNDKPTEVQEQDLENFNKGIETIRKFILQIEKSVEPARGEWVDNGIPHSILSKCSACGYSGGAFSFNFCPNCGADMRKKVEE